MDFQKLIHKVAYSRLLDEKVNEEVFNELKKHFTYKQSGQLVLLYLKHIHLKIDTESNLEGKCLGPSLQSILLYE